MCLRSQTISSFCFVRSVGFFSSSKCHFASGTGGAAGATAVADGGGLYSVQFFICRHITVDDIVVGWFFRPIFACSLRTHANN